MVNQLLGITFLNIKICKYTSFFKFSFLQEGYVNFLNISGASSKKNPLSDFLWVKP